jgi:tetratricopeptide (TPR) repeat protein
MLTIRSFLSYISPTMKLVATLLFTVVLAACSDFGNSPIDRAIAYHNRGKYNEAIRIYTEVIKEHSKFQLPYYNRGLCYLNLEDYRRALADFNKVMSLQTRGDFIFTENSNSPFASEESQYQVPYNDALYLKAQALYYLDSIENSLRDFKILIAANYQKSNCLVWEGCIWIQYGKNDRACSAFTQARQFAVDKLDTKEAEEYIAEYCK